MDPLKINLATFEYFDKRIASLGLVFILLVLGGLSLYNVSQSIQGRKEILSYRGKIHRLEKTLAKHKKAREKVRKKLKGEEMRMIREGTVFVNRIIAKEAFPWDRLLDVIEAGIPQGVVLRDLTVGNDFKSVQLRGVAHSSEEIGLFLAHLKKSGVFRRNLLTKLSVGKKEKKIASGRADAGILFEIENTLNMAKLFSGPEYKDFVRILVKTFKASGSH